MLHLQHDFCLFKTPTNIKKGVSLQPVFALSLSRRVSLFPSLPSPPYPMPESSPMPQQGVLRCGEPSTMRWSNNFSPLSQFFSSLLHPQSIFCTTALPPLIHQRKSPTNFLYKQVRLWLQLPGTCSPTKVTQAQTSPETTHTLPESLSNTLDAAVLTSAP